MPDYERTRTVNAPSEALFSFLAETDNLPRYFPRMESAERTGPDTLRVRATIDGRTEEGEAWFRVDHSAKRIEWGSEGPNQYHGGLSVSGDGPHAQVELQLHTERDAGDEIDRGIDETLDTICRLVEEEGAAQVVTWSSEVRQLDEGANPAS